MSLLVLLRVLRQGSPTAFKSRLTQFARQSNVALVPNNIYESPANTFAATSSIQLLRVAWKTHINTGKTKSCVTKKKIKGKAMQWIH